MKTTPFAFPGFVTALVITAAACWPSGLNYGADTFSEEFERSYPFNAEGEVAVSAINGSITVEAWDRDECKVRAVKTGERQEDLDAIEVEVVADPGRVEIRTQFKTSPKRKNIKARVDYRLWVPTHARLDKISNVNGLVEIEGVKGKVDASTVNGKLKVNSLGGEVNLSTVNGVLEAAFPGWEGVDRLSAACVNGKVVLRLPQEVNADLSVTALHCRLGTDFDLPVKKNKPFGSEIKGRLGTGGTPIKASTVNGSVQIEGLR